METWNIYYIHVSYVLLDAIFVTLAENAQFRCICFGVAPTRGLKRMSFAIPLFVIRETATHKAVKNPGRAITAVRWFLTKHTTKHSAIFVNIKRYNSWNYTWRSYPITRRNRWLSGHGGVHGGRSVDGIKGPFTWKEDDPSARIILESSFGLHAKTRLLGSTLNLVYMKFTCKILCSARLQSKRWWAKRTKS